MNADFSKIYVGIITDDNVQQHIIRSALIALGFKVIKVSSPMNLEDKWFTSSDVQLWIIDIIQQNKSESFIDRMIEESPATLMFSDGNAPPTYSGKYPRWQKRLLVKISKLLKLGDIEIPKQVIQARVAEIKSNLNNLAGDEDAINVENFITNQNSEQVPGLAKRVWVLGASLGGPAAVKIFLDALEPDLPIAFVLAQHIDEGFQALLGQVLGRNNNFKLIKEFDRVQLKNGEILIAPADNAISITSTHHIINSADDWEGIYSPSINQVMRIVAEKYGALSGAIIFSGMGDDSAKSAEFMNSVGGTIWAQSEETCANSSQPDSIRQTGYVTYSGSPQQLAAKLSITLKNEK